MSKRGMAAVTAFGAALILVAVVASAPAGQTAADGTDVFTPAQTPWGDPDLQGIWSPGYILTPLERSEEFSEQEFLTDDDVAALEERANVRRRDVRAEPGSVEDVEGAYNEAFTGRGKEVIRTRRTSRSPSPTGARRWPPPRARRCRASWPTGPRTGATWTAAAA